MTAQRLTTTQRGLGAAHQQLSKRMRANMPDGQPCAKCGQPMHKWQPIELDHLIPRAYGGAGGPVALTHRRCNRRAGAIIGNRSPKRRARRAIKAAAYTRW